MFGSALQGTMAQLVEEAPITNEDIEAAVAASQTEFAGGINVSGPFKLTDTPPSSATDTGEPGQVAVDAGFVYVCVDTNLWRRVQLEIWPRVFVITTGNFTITKEMHGCTFINTGQTGSITMVAPTDAPIGTRYRVIANSTDNHVFWFKVDGGATVRHGANVTSDGPYYQAVVGRAYEIELIETGKWLLTNAEGEVLDATSGSPF